MVWHRYDTVRDVAASLKSDLYAAEVAHTEALTKLQCQRDALFNSMVEGVLIVDASGRIGLINSALKQFAGLSSGLEGRTILEVFRSHELSQLIARAALAPDVRD